MITFTNPGEIDPRLISTLGVNVKDTESPIGFFGTGLKYAIAVALREDAPLTIHSGLRIITFTKVPDTVRGKEFDFVTMHNTDVTSGGCISQLLGFTADLGRNWTLENAYRELWANCRDEHGTVDAVADDTPTPLPEANVTRIIARGPAWHATHDRCFDFLLDPSRTKLASDGDVEAYAGASPHVFYKGIAAQKLRCKSAVTYNLTTDMTLTEDRTLKHGWEAEHHIAEFLVSAATYDVLAAAFGHKDTFESTINYAFVSQPADHVLDSLERIYNNTRASQRPDALIGLLSRGKRCKLHEQRVREATPRELDAIATATAFCHAIGFAVDDYPIRVADLVEDILALAAEGTIYLAPAAFASQELLCRALLEEFMHLRYRVRDESREMQNVLFGEIVALGRRLVAQQGEKGI